MTNTLTNISPLDGRYELQLEPLREYFSEAALIRARLYVEVEWLVFICNGIKLKGTRRITKEEEAKLRKIYEGWDIVAKKRYERVKDIEKTTNHDVKAVEYLIKEEMRKTSMRDLLEFVHFACTSEDITNTAYAFLLKTFLEKSFIPKTEEILYEIKEIMRKHKSVPMLSFTHGQPASPTTMGKEFKIFYKRLERQIGLLKNQEHFAKINGATGNYNAHIAAYPDIDWVKASEGFLQRLGLQANLYTAQIEPHDYLAEVFHKTIRINNVVFDMVTDIWMYIHKNYFTQRIVEGEIGSSTMPHKVNPIDFENAEGNLGISNALLSHFAEKLPVSRLQRDLSDSTVLRNVGVAFGHGYLAMLSATKGLSKLEINKSAINRDLDNNWEVLGEAIQTVMRKHKIEGAYEKLKELTRGKRLDQEKMVVFIEGLEIPKEDKELLKKLTPGKYIGLANKL